MRERMTRLLKAAEITLNALVSRRLAAVLLCLLAPVAGAAAQETPRRFAVGGGAILFAGADGPDGLGVFLRSTARVARFGSTSSLTLELALSQYLIVGQACDLAVPPGGCSRTGPPASVWSAGVGLHQLLAHSPRSPYVLFGIGAYSNINKPSDPAQAAVGLDLGLGVPLSPKLALDARFVWLNSSRSRAWSTPVGVSLGL